MGLPITTLAIGFLQFFVRLAIGPVEDLVNDSGLLDYNR